MDPFFSWIESLKARHMAGLEFPEVRRAVQALSSIYVQRRHRLDVGGPLESRGKRAAFAVYFAPLHFLLVREIVRGLEIEVPAKIVDLGCGIGSAGAAWASEGVLSRAPRVIGIDRNPWAVREARWTYEEFRLVASARTVDIAEAPLSPDAAVIAAFTVNELPAPGREKLRRNLIAARNKGAPVLIVEPIARRALAWWDEWARDFRDLGGREDEWRFRTVLPEFLALMDRAAGLHHEELTGRSLWLPRPDRGIVP